MRSIFTFLALFLLAAFQGIGQSSVSATYTAGVINANYGSYSATCNAANTLTLSVPAGSNIVGMDVSYQIVAQNGAWMMEQYSRIECITTTTSESSYYTGSGYGGTMSYSRTGVDIANGISTGSVQFRMQLYRSWGGSACDSYYQYVPSGTWSITVYYCPATTPFTPIIAQDTLLATCGADSAMISANSSYTSWSWSNGGTGATTYVHESGLYSVEAFDAGGCPYTDDIFVSLVNPDITPSDTAICLGLGDSVELNALGGSGGGCINVNAFLESNYAVVDHNSASGDDRGGIAVTQDYFYYVGDNYTVRMDASNLGGQTSLPVRDGIFSDLNNGQLYSFWSTTYNDFYNGSPYTAIDAIREMDASLAYGTTITLSQSINAGYGSFVAAGSGFVILWASSSSTFYHIDLSSGTVTNIGSGSLQSYSNPGIYMYSTENWAKWGIAECNGNDYSIVGRANYVNGTYYYSPSVMGRWDITAGTASIVTTFSGATSDMGCITYSRWEDRWYFHYEGSGMFGGSAETAGYADIDAEGGSGGAFTFNWSTSDTTSSILVMPSTNTDYTVTVSDGVQSCSDTASITVNPTPEISLNITDIACKGDSLGAVASTVNSGTSPFTYTWTPMDTNMVLSPNNTSSITNIPSGNYYLLVVDDNGCYDMDTAYVWEPLSVLSPILSGINNPRCSYSADGRAIVLPAGGDGPYDFSWSNSSTNDTNLFLAAGPFTVTITDANGCERILSGSVTAPPAVVQSFTSTPNECEDDDDGTATVTATGGTPPYAYLWDNGATTTTATHLTSGFHVMEVSDMNNCLFADSVEVLFNNPAPNIAFNDFYEKCAEVVIVLDAGTGAATYSWSTGDTSQTLSTSAGGFYAVTVTGANGCEAKKTTFIQNNNCPTGIESTLSNGASVLLYPNPSNGMISLEIQGSLNQAIDLQVSDLAGRTVMSQPAAITSGNSITPINMTSLAKGTYLLRLISKGVPLTVHTVVIQ